MTDYRLQLDVFEGPLDVLLYLIRRDEVDIYDIPIAHITEQYVSFLDQARTDNLEIAGEFLLMAATLVQIKARMLLPVTHDDEEDEFLDEGDPRAELVERLIEYRQFRDVAQELHTREKTERDYFPRTGARMEDDENEEEDVPTAVGEVNLYDLLTAFSNVLRYAEDAPIAEVEPQKFTLEQSIAETTGRLRESKSLRFTDLFDKGSTRLLMVCTFLAVLELIRLRRVRARQGNVLDEIRVYWIGDDGDDEIE
jgi:segregation and condensation protein A